MTVFSDFTRAFGARIGKALPVLFLCLPIVAHAQTAAPAPKPGTGGPLYDVPQGWTREVTKSGLSLTKTYAPAADKRGKGMASIQVFAPNEPVSTFETNFRGVADALPELRKEKPGTVSNGVTASGYRIRTESKCCAYKSDVMFAQQTVGITDGNRQVIFMFLMANLRGDNRDLADEEFSKIIRSVRFKPTDKPSGLSPRPGDGGLSGVYTFLRTGIRPNVFGGTDFYAESDILVFDPSGLYATELPKNGETLARHCQHTPRECGLYNLKKVPGQIEMADVRNDFGVIEAEMKPLARKGTNLVIDGDEHKLIPPIKPGTTMNGSWRYFFAQTGQMAFSSNSVAVEKTLVLRPDGTFTRTGWAGTSGSNDMGTGTSSVVTQSKRPLESGRYRFDGYGLYLTGADGQQEGLSVFMPDIGSDELLVINGANYLKQK